MSSCPLRRKTPKDTEQGSEPFNNSANILDEDMEKLPDKILR